MNKKKHPRKQAESRELHDDEPMYRLLAETTIGAAYPEDFEFCRYCLAIDNQTMQCPHCGLSGSVITFATPEKTLDEVTFEELRCPNSGCNTILARTGDLGK